ncbi:MAG: hypothetical protein QOE65_2296 [Solirubrobacteraceae bacterium]|jgi:hypothetical protein|nr:hypothetical protein [Solirubrobacteraceae bacterium]
MACRAAAIACVLVAVGAVAPAAGAATFTWGTGVATLGAGSSIPAYNGIACPSATRCVAVTDAGQEVTFDPAAVGTPSAVVVDAGKTLYGVACPTPTQCTAVDDSGHQVTFDPTNAAATANLTTILPGAVRAIACPAATQCTAVGDASKALTFNPASPPNVAGGTATGAVGELFGIACPSVTQCAAVSQRGDLVTFDPTGSGFTVTTIVPDPAPGNNQNLNGIACPSETQCTAVDVSGRALTFSPAAPGMPTRVATGSPYLRGIACPAVNLCVLADNGGSSIEGDPTTPSSWTKGSLNPVRGINSVACTSVTRCVLAGLEARVYVGTGTGVTPPGGGNPGAGSPKAPNPGPASPGPTQVVPQPRGGNPILTGFGRGRVRTARVGGNGAFTLPGTTATCAPGAATCQLTLDLTGTILVNRLVAFGTARRTIKVRLGSSKRKIAPGRSVTVVPRLSATGLKALVKAKQLKATLTLKIVQGTTRRTAIIPVTLLAPRPRRHS